MEQPRQQFHDMSISFHLPVWNFLIGNVPLPEVVVLSERKKVAHTYIRRARPLNAYELHNADLPLG